jgi:unsaturated rhamnogalacturonyl hydrolase
MNVKLLCVLMVPFVALSLAQTPPLGRSEPHFSQPSRAPGVDYVVPTEQEIKATLDRVLDHFVRSTPYRVIDTATVEPVTDLTKPTATAAVQGREFNEWDYPMGVALAGMLLTTDVTGDARYQEYALKNFDFIFDHEPFFRKQAELFGRPRSFGRLLYMRDLDSCGAIGAALVKAYAKKQDPRYRKTIDLIAEYISHKQMRLADRTLARPRPQPVAVWIDDAYMSIPFLAQMGRLTKDRAYFDDGARQVIGMSALLQNKDTGLYDHSWFENTPNDPKFYWGRGCGWMFMAAAELLSVLPEDHPDRPKVLAIFRKAAEGVAWSQGGTGLWHQLLDKTDSYLETSASAMFTFGIARGVNRGWLPVAYAPVAQAGWQALATRVRPDGQIEGICVSTTAAYDSVYYYNRPAELGAMQGYGPVILAGAEVITMLRSFQIDRNLNTFHYRVKK